MEVLGRQLPINSVPAIANFSSLNGGFTPDVPASFVTTIQSGEFSDLSKLLPENLIGIAHQDKDTLQLSMGSDSTIRILRGRPAKARMQDIESWTTAFTCCMCILLDRFPARAKDLVALLDESGSLCHHPPTFQGLDHVGRKVPSESIKR